MVLTEVADLVVVEEEVVALEMVDVVMLVVMNLRVEVVEKY